MIEEIYEMYSRKVFLFLLSKTNNEDIAEELTQETFFQAVQCIDRFKGNSSILNLVMRNREKCLVERFKKTSRNLIYK